MTASKPPAQRQRRNKEPLVRGEWTSVTEVGWQHGPIPSPGRVRATTKRAWQQWMESWVAARWLATDVPALVHLAHLYDVVSAGDMRSAPELRQMLDAFGLTPKGRQDRRWMPPEQVVADTEEADDAAEPYAGLRVVG